MISFEVRGSDQQGIARVEVKLDQDPHFFVEFCQNEKDLVNLPEEDGRIWTFIKHGLDGISIECNGVEVGRIMFKDSTIASDCLVSKWTTEKVAGVHFNTAEEASTGIRGRIDIVNLSLTFTFRTIVTRNFIEFIKFTLHS